MRRHTGYAPKTQKRLMYWNAPNCARRVWLNAGSRGIQATKRGEQAKYAQRYTGYAHLCSWRAQARPWLSCGTGPTLVKLNLLCPLERMCPFRSVPQQVQGSEDVTELWGDSSWSGEMPRLVCGCPAGRGRCREIHASHRPESVRRLAARP